MGRLRFNANKESEVLQKEKEIVEKDKVINTQQSRLNKLFESISILKEYDFIIRLCDTIKIPIEIIK